MSTLQISLAVLGIILLAAVLAYNTWTYRRAAPKRAKPQAAPVEAAPRQEPNLAELADFPADFSGHASANASANFSGMADLDGVGAVQLSAGAGDDSDAVGVFLADDPVLQASASSPTSDTLATQPQRPAEAPAPVADKRGALDALIDAIASLRLDRATAGEIILQVQPTTRRAGSKPFQVEGRNYVSGQWEPVRAGQRYVLLQAGVQLANRLGPLNEIEFSEFVLKVQTFADSLGAALELPDMLREVARARELDQFASQHDAQLSFMLRPVRAAWSPGYITQQAAALGFAPTSMPGRMALPAGTAGGAAGAAPLLVLSFDPQAAQAEDLDRTAVYDLLLSLDVPQVPQALQPFTRLCETLHTLAAHMDGALCDPDGNPLPAAALEPIGQQLAEVYATLAAHEVAAGSMLARRLFS